MRLAEISRGYCKGLYVPDVLYCSTTPAGTRPRSLTSSTPSFDPLADLGSVDDGTFAPTSASAPGRAAGPPRVREALRQRFAQLVAVGGAEVDLVWVQLVSSEMYGSAEDVSPIVS